MKIRKYRESDDEGMLESLKRSIREVATEDYPVEVIEEWSDRDLSDKEIEDEKFRYVAVEDGKVVGHGDFNKETNELSGLYIHPDYTGQGIGRKLLEKLEEKAREEGLEELWCKSTITARDFYQKHGWELVEETTHDLGENEMQAFKLEKEL